MTGYRMRAMLLGAVTLLLVACTEDKKPMAVPADSEVPTLAVDSMKINAVTLHEGDTVSTGTVTFFGRANDNSGFFNVSGTVNGTAISASWSLADTVWSVTTGLRPGVNTLGFVATDAAGNTGSAVRHLFYRANYLPMSRTSKWQFRYGLQDTITLAVDSTWQIDNYKCYGLTMTNTDDDVSDAIVLANDTVTQVFRVGRNTISAISGPRLFLENYTPATIAYDSASVRFIGDTTLLSADSVAVQYQNCVKVTFANAANKYIMITSYYLIPDFGFVSVVTIPSPPAYERRFRLVTTP